MLIEPNSIFRIYSGLPLDNTYEHTLWFETIEAQRTFFAQNIKRTLTSQTYQRVSKGVMRVQMPISELYDCNYISFQNTSYGNKWFYGFITNAEYVNDVTSEITYEIDVMQTYLFDVELMDCFVDREHSSSDNVGDNIIDEGIDIGDYYSEDGEKTHLFDDYTVAMISPYTFIGSTPTKAWTDRLICNNPCVLVNYYYMSTNLDNALAKFSADLLALDSAGHSNEIVSVYMIPTGFVEQEPTDFRGKLPTDVVNKLHDGGLKPTTLGTYTPRNKKLLTYPFNKLTVTTYTDEHDYAYEYFSTDHVNFSIFGNLTPNSSFKAVPLNYKGETNNYDDGIVLSDIPLVAYSSDNYAEWLARNKTRLGIQGVTGLLGSKGGIEEVIQGSMMTNKSGKVSAWGAKHIAKGITEIGESSIGTVSDLISQCVAAKTFGSSSQGSTDGSLEIAMKRKDFIFLHKFVNPKYAEVIDNYFDRYGYATRIIKKPNRNARRHWTYTKTVGCVVKGSAPCDAITDICAIYDKGITFWNNANNVGKYTLLRDTNTPL